MHDVAPIHITLVIPVYQGELSLPSLLEEIAPMTAELLTSKGRRFVVNEVLLVHDCGPDRSDRTLLELAHVHPFVRPIWLTRNFGQHAATLAGMASATGDFVVTIDEDGQQDPNDIGLLLDVAISDSLQVVYARPLNPPPHSWLRNACSRGAKSIAAKFLGTRQAGLFNSFRLVDGEIARTLAAYCSNGVYLDVALVWIAGRIGSCGIMLRRESERSSGYSYSRLLAHFWTLVMTSGTQPLRLITVVGFGSMLTAVAVAFYAIYVKLYGHDSTQGWASLIVVVSFFSGSILMALGMIAEYLAMTMTIAMGKPLYVVGTKPVVKRVG